MTGVLEYFRWMEVASEKLDGRRRTPGVNSPWGESCGRPRVWTQHWNSGTVQQGTWLGGDRSLGAQVDFGKRDVLSPEKIPGDQGSSTPSPTLPRAQSSAPRPPGFKVTATWTSVVPLARRARSSRGREGGSRLAGNSEPSSRRDGLIPVVWLLFFSLRRSYLRLSFWIELKLVLFTGGRELRKKMKNRLSACRLQTELFDWKAKRGVAWFYTPHQQTRIRRLLEVCNSVGEFGLSCPIFLSCS